MCRSCIWFGLGLFVPSADHFLSLRARRARAFLISINSLLSTDPLAVTACGPLFRHDQYGLIREASLLFPTPSANARLRLHVICSVSAKFSALP